VDVSGSPQPRYTSSRRGVLSEYLDYCRIIMKEIKFEFGEVVVVSGQACRGRLMHLLEAFNYLTRCINNIIDRIQHQ
jgi:hypothetical protein